MEYSQSFDGEKGEGEFFILLRSLDNMEEVFGERWNPKGSVTALDTGVIYAEGRFPDPIVMAATPLDVKTDNEYKNG